MSRDKQILVVSRHFSKRTDIEYLADAKEKGRFSWRLSGDPFKDTSILLVVHKEWQ